MTEQQDNSSANRRGKLPPVAVELIRYVLGFSVSVSLGLAPFLGKLDVPGFSPMLSFIPCSLQDLAIPLSSAAMGLVAIGTQWRASMQHRTERIVEKFRRTIQLSIIALAVLTAVEIFGVVQIDVPAVNRTAAFAIGPIHPHRFPCESLGRAECIHKIGLNENQINGYFGETQVNLTKCILVIAYVTFMSCFGALVGMLITGRKRRSRMVK
jgi:hypothetical protein